MPVHDWTLVDAGLFHGFHSAWIPEISKRLNTGLLPKGFYALAEQHAGRSISDVLTLQIAPPDQRQNIPPREDFAGGQGTAVAEAPPKVRWRETFENGLAARQRTLSIRHVSGHRLVAILEIVSPGNKDRLLSTEQFASKVLQAIHMGIHVLVVDLIPPGPFDPHGMHGLIRQEIDVTDTPYLLPPSEPLTLASYSAGATVEVFTEHLAVGSVLVDMPLFLSPGRYVNAPLEAAYQEAWSGMPAFWKEVLEGRPQ